MSDEAAQQESKPKRRRTDPISVDEWREAIEDRLDQGSENMRGMQKAIVSLQGEMIENTKLTRKALTRNDEVYEFLMAGRNIWGVFSVVGGWMSKLIRAVAVLIKWGGVVATGGLAIYAAYYALRHGGQLPPELTTSKGAPEK